MKSSREKYESPKQPGRLGGGPPFAKANKLSIPKA